MSDVISKELLSEVLGIEVISISKIQNNIINGGKEIVYSFSNKEDFIEVGSINIHELSSDTEQWLEDKGYYICKPYYDTFELYKGATKLYSIITAGKRYKKYNIPFQFCQWILDNKDKK